MEVLKSKNENTTKAFFESKVTEWTEGDYFDISQITDDTFIIAVGMFEGVNKRHYLVRSVPIVLLQGCNKANFRCIHNNKKRMELVISKDSSLMISSNSDETKYFITLTKNNKTLQIGTFMYDDIMDVSVLTVKEPGLRKRITVTEYKDGEPLSTVTLRGDD